SPAPDSVAATSEVRVSVSAAAQWRVEHTPPGGATSELARGSSDFADLVAVLSAPDGQHHLSLVATDSAGNSTQATLDLTLDTAPPLVSFVSPTGGAHVSGASGYVEVRAALQEANLQRLELNLARGGAPRSLAVLTALPATGLVALWDASTEPDGPATLELVATDRTGAVSRATIAITLDSTPPAAQLDTPMGVVARADVEFRGTATDAHLRRYTIAFASGAPPTSPAFATLAIGSAPVSAGALASPATLPANGTYTFRLSVEDEAGNLSVSERAATIQAQPPVPPPSPTGVQATLAPPSSVQLTWAEPAASGPLTYRVRRGQPPSPIASGVTGLVYFDPALADGTYVYDVIAVDAQGVESAPSATTSVVIDRAPPTVAIARPRDGARVGGVTQVVGTASSGPSFEGYSLYLGSGAGERLVATSNQPVSGGRLGELDVRGLTEGSVQTLRLVATSLYGGSRQISSAVIIDNTAPAAPSLTGATATGSTVTITWQPSPSPDVAGYLLLRNEQIANAPDGTSGGDLTPWLLPKTATSFQDVAVVDGTHTYKLLAVDEASNLSPPSNVRTVTVETRTPRAAIVSPAADAVLRTSTLVVAESADLDVDRVQFELRPLGASAFAPLGGPVSPGPFTALLNPLTLSPGQYELRAVATDGANNTDVAAPATRIAVERELGPLTLAARVDGATVLLTWTTGSSGSTAGYDIYRDGALRAQLPASASSFSDVVLALGARSYELRARSLFGQVVTATQTANVYVPIFRAPDPFIALPAVFRGSNVPPGATVTITTVAGAVVAVATASTTGEFEATISLDNEQITAAAVDAAGNRSLASPAVGTHPPAQPTLALVQQNGTNLAFQVTLSQSGFQNVALWRGATGEAPVLVQEQQAFGATFNFSDRVAGGSYGYYAVVTSGPYASLPSNVVQVTVVDVEPAPSNLTATVGANGTTVHLTWGSSSPVLLFSVERASGSGAFSPIGSAGSLAFDDTSAGAGGSYRYRVRFDDGTQFSPYSNVAVAALAPPAPRVLRPVDGTVAARAREPVVGLSKVAGVAEVLRGPQQQVVAQVAVGPERFTALPVSLHGATPAGEVAIARDGAHVAYVDTSSGPRRLVLARVDDPRAPDGAPGPSTPLVDDAIGAAQFSPDGTKVAVATSFGTLVVHDLASGAQHVVHDVAGTAFAWSQDSARVACAGYRASGMALLTHDVATAAENLLTTANDARVPHVSALAFGFDSVLAVVSPSGPVSGVTAGLVQFRSNGLSTQLVAAPHVGALTVTAQGAWAFAHSENSQSWTVTRSGSPTNITASSPPAIAFDPTGARLAVLTGTRLELLGDQNRSFDGAVPAPGHLVWQVLDGPHLLSPGAPPLLIQFDPMYSPQALSLQGQQPAGEVVLDARAQHAAFIDVSGAVVLVTLDGSAQPVTVIADGRPPLRFAPDGSRLAGFSADPVDGSQHLFVYDLPTESLLSLGLDPAVEQLPPLAWDSVQNQGELAYVSRDGAAKRLVFLYIGSIERDYGLIDEDVRDLAVSFGTAWAIVHDGASNEDVLYRVTQGDVQEVAREARLVSVVSDQQSVAVATSEDPDEPWSVVYLRDGLQLEWRGVTSSTEAPSLHLDEGANVLAFFDGRRFTLMGARAPRPIETYSGPGLPTGRLHLTADGTPALEGTRPQRLVTGFPFSTAATLAPGANLLSARIAGQNAVVGPASAAITVYGPNVAVEDLAVTVALQPPMPAAGAPAHAVVTTTNVGTAPSPSTPLRVTVVTSSGATRSLPLETVSALSPGQSTSNLVALDLTGLVGLQQLLVSVDPFHTTAELNRDNNNLTHPFTISPSAAPSLLVSHTVTGEVLRADVTAFNPGATAADLRAVVAIESAAGVTVLSAPAEVFGTFDAATSRGFTRLVDLGLLPSGSYVLAGELYRGAVRVDRETRPITISRTPTATLRLTASRASYGTTELVDLEALVTNTSSSELLQGAQLRLAVVDASGHTVYDQQLGAPSLGGGSSAARTFSFSAATLGAGSYSAVARLLLGTNELAAAPTTFSIIANASLTGTLTVAGSTTSPPRLPEGMPAMVTYSIFNGGLAPATGVEVVLTLLNPATGVVSTQTRSAGDLAAGAGTSGTVDLGLPGSPATYAVSLAARSGTGPLVVLDTTPLYVADGTPPALSINLAPGQLVRSSTLLRVLATDPNGVAAVRVSVDGAAPAPLAFTSGAPASGTWQAQVPFAGDGLHTLVVSASDTAGNDGLAQAAATNPLTVTVQVDGTAPQLTVTGVADGARYAHAVTPVFSASDAHGVTLAATLDGLPFASGQTVGDGDHVLVVTATDPAFNVSVVIARFTVDTRPPTLVLTGVEHGAQAQPPVTLHFFALDTSAVQVTATLDGLPLSTGTVVTGLGPHTWSVTAVDTVGNTVSATREFELVTNVLAVAISGVANGAVVQGPVTPTVTATGAASVAATLNGAPFTPGSPIVAEGSYVLSATATSASGLTSTRTVTFAIDRTPPSLTLQGPAGGSHAGTPPTLVFSASDLHLA
ncbi:MAG: hypothetical protein JNK82_37680, partial [Myxococcaceae bacterium]|nr:hypothetical protein [Myxococcaceae bacterium]